MFGTDTVSLMAERKKKPSGKNVTPRKPVQVPVAWLEVARERARANRQPLLWYLIDLIKKDAEANGRTEFPTEPWEE